MMEMHQLDCNDESALSLLRCNSDSSNATTGTVPVSGVPSPLLQCNNDVSTNYDECQVVMKLCN